MRYGLVIKDDNSEWYFMNFNDLESLSNFLKKTKFYLKHIPDYMIIKYSEFTYNEVVLDE